jgi:hypothetical protein
LLVAKSGANRLVNGSLCLPLVNLTDLYIRTQKAKGYVIGIFFADFLMAK